MYDCNECTFFIPPIEEWGEHIQDKRIEGYCTLRYPRERSSDVYDLPLHHTTGCDLGRPDEDDEG